jgi:hypothetical protein
MDPSVSPVHLAQCVLLDRFPLAVDAPEENPDQCDELSVRELRGSQCISNLAQEGIPNISQSSEMV